MIAISVFLGNKMANFGPIYLTLKLTTSYYFITSHRNVRQKMFLKVYPNNSEHTETKSKFCFINDGQINLKYIFQKVS